MPKMASAKPMSVQFRPEVPEHRLMLFGETSRRAPSSAGWSRRNSGGRAEASEGGREDPYVRSRAALAPTPTNCCTRREASAEASLNSSYFLSKKLCGAPG